MKLYVLRHGETNENTTGMLQGNMDTLLNDNGRIQAKEVSQEILNKNIDLVIASPKKRTIETANIAAANIPVITDIRLLSRNHGEFEGRSKYEIDFKDYWDFNKNTQYLKAESVNDLFIRVKSLLEEVKEKYKDKNILLVTHSGICRMIYYYFNGLPEDGNLKNYESSNCSFEEYDL